MKKFIKFPKIMKFEDIVKDIKHVVRYKGKDENGNLIYSNELLPIITATATEKIHGTNAAVCYNNIDGFWVQKRTAIITPKNDNVNCAFYAYKYKDTWMQIIKELSEKNNIDLNENTISVFYEWAGKNIQKGSAVSGTNDYLAFIFPHFLITNNKTNKSKFLKTNISIKNNDICYKDNIYFIESFKTYTVKIDFNFPKIAENKFKEFVDYVENNSPVAKYFGKPENPGEGLVWTFWYKNELYRFKTKGEKHNKGLRKAKKINKVDSEEINKIIDFVNQYAIKTERLEQIWQKVFGINNEKYQPEMRFLGEFLKEYNKDVWAEEMNVVLSNNIDIKKANKFINQSAKNWFIEKLKNEIYEG